MMCAFLRKSKWFLLVVMDNLITIAVCVILHGNMLWPVRARSSLLAALIRARAGNLQGPYCFSNDSLFIFKF